MKTISSSRLAVILAIGLILVLPASVAAGLQTGLSAAPDGMACEHGVFAKEEAPKPDDKKDDEEECD